MNWSRVNQPTDL